MSFQGVDFLNIDSQLQEEERITRDKIREFVDAQIIPGIEEHFEAHTFPDEIVPKLGAQGLLGPFVPERYGGSDSSYVVHGLICQETRDAAARNKVTAATATAADERCVPRIHLADIAVSAFIVA